MGSLTPIPAALRVEDTCDFCLRDFARIRGEGAICPSCGCENPRTDARTAKIPLRESAMLGPGPEKAVLTPPRPRPARKKRR
jgi:hypothetical protein